MFTIMRLFQEGGVGPGCDVGQLHYIPLSESHRGRARFRARAKEAGRRRAFLLPLCTVMGASRLLALNSSFGFRHRGSRLAPNSVLGDWLEEKAGARGEPGPEVMSRGRPARLTGPLLYSDRKYNIKDVQHS